MDYPSEEVLSEVKRKWEEMTAGRPEDWRPMKAVMDEIDEQFRVIEERLFAETLEFNRRFDAGELPCFEDDEHTLVVGSSVPVQKALIPRERYEASVLKSNTKERRKTTHEAKRMKKKGTIRDIGTYFQK